uniref:Baseplate J-like protein n=1 Tax=Candidatus Kentrum sp. DK TaxID=2126562 RepID=A0A450RV88_9GAMM|nr:MAG: Baseplate J-like protein [Candidatus Kentron sp. DK]
MLNQTSYQQILSRDGASQARRDIPALDPDYFSVDERTLGDLLAFGQAYARELRYYNEQNQAAGDWSAFLSPDLDPAEVAAFLDDPESLAPERAERYSRPHLVLFLVFLQLLRHVQAQMNTLTRRHLDFYFEKALAMTRKAAVPDRVRVLVEPASGVDRFLLPAGTELDAGRDALGKSLAYRTDQDIVVNRARVERLSSLHVQKRLTGIREARESHTGTKRESFLAMFGIALGDPLPGDPLPSPVGRLPAHGDAQQVDYDYLLYLDTLTAFVPDTLYMDFMGFRTLMRLKQQRDTLSGSEWQEINDLLKKAGQARIAGFGWGTEDGEPADPTDFEANMETAFGAAPNQQFFAGITLVEDIYDLYAQRAREEVKTFIRDALHFENLDDFVGMMQRKVRMDGEWAEINRILEKAGRAKGTLAADAVIPPAGGDPMNFSTNLQTALGTLDYSALTGIANLDQYHGALLQVESYFFLSIGNFRYLLSVTEREENQDAPPSTTEWTRVYELLAGAYREKVHADRRGRLAAIREESGFDAMIRFALGEESSSATSDDPLPRLQPFVGKDDDYVFLAGLDPASEATDWARVYRIVELAWRAREQFPEPMPNKMEWLNLYPAEDATAVTVSLGIAADRDNPRWRTFGRAPIDVGEDTPPPAVFGWAVASPLLLLGQGTRTITLTLGFDVEGFREDRIAPLFVKPSDPALSDETPFAIHVSTEKGWIAPDKLEFQRGDYYALSGVAPPADSPALPGIRLTLTFADTADAIAPLSGTDIAGMPISGEAPVLRLLLRQTWDAAKKQYIAHYQPLRDLVLVNVAMRVSVAGMSEFRIGNDDGALDVKTPFEPFGAEPAVGSCFFLGHTEFYKRLDRLTFHIQWMGLPEDMATRYKNYDAAITNTGFTINVDLFDQRMKLPFADGKPLFGGFDAVRKTYTLAITDIADTVTGAYPNYQYGPTPFPDTDQGADYLQDSRRYLRWALQSPDFQHGAYPIVANRKALELGIAMAGQTSGIDPEDYRVDPPYTPRIRRITIDYSASLDLEIKDYRGGTVGDRLFHIHPFGFDEARAPETDASGWPFLPRYDDEGELYLGLRDLPSPCNLHLLFRMAEGSANPDLTPARVRWDYLSDNRWLGLEDGNILSDTTRGLINSGIVRFDLPAARPNTLLPPHLYWVRASVAEGGASVCDTAAIGTQAVAATFVDRDNDPERLATPLPAESIRGPIEPRPGLGSIHQPDTSIGGKVRERDDTFRRRVSERLRHRQRALDLWDYEHLILERFPEIYKVKCLPAGSEEPGAVRVVIIPDIRNRLPFNPFEPKAPTDLMADIQSWLADKVPAFADVTVKNARYVAVKTRFGVRFRAGYNAGYYRQVLNDDLNRFLSPWAYTEGGDVVIGGRIYANSLIDFIERRPYVDYVAQIKLFRSENGEDFKLVPASSDDTAPGYWVESEWDDGVLVAARNHEIDLIAETGYEAVSFSGIGYMKVELDLVVN